MNVKISYTVDLERVPDKTGELLSESAKDLITSRRNLEEIISGIQDDKRISILLEEIDSLRKLLLKVDNSLSDSVSLLSGYMQTKAAMAAPYPQELDGGPSAPNSEE